MLNAFNTLWQLNVYPCTIKYCIPMPTGTEILAHYATGVLVLTDNKLNILDEIRFQPGFLACW